MGLPWGKRKMESDMGRVGSVNVTAMLVYAWYMYCVCGIVNCQGKCGWILAYLLFKITCLGGIAV